MEMGMVCMVKQGSVEMVRQRASDEQEGVVPRSLLERGAGRAWVERDPGMVAHAGKEEQQRRLLAL
jgi:hypothetical protein